MTVRQSDRQTGRQADRQSARGSLHLFLTGDAAHGFGRNVEPGRGDLNAAVDAQTIGTCLNAGQSGLHQVDLGG